MKAMIILNPHAHSGTEPQAQVALHDEISAHLKSALHLENVEWRQTEHPGHGKELAEEAARKGYDYVFAGGGDGTVNEVLNGIMGPKVDQKKRPVLGVLPFGSSNDFFAALKAAEALPKSDSDNNVTLVLDVGHARFDTVERYFCLTVGIGLWSWANEQYLAESKTFGRRFAHIPAAITTILSYQYLPNVSLSLDGSPSQARRILSIVINNSPVIAGGIPLTPDAAIDDGHFDVAVVKPVSLPRLIALIFQVATKTHLHSPSALVTKHIREITVTAKKALPINVDGELVPELDSKARRIAIEVMQGALRVVVPSLCEITPQPSEVSKLIAKFA
jgi:diacylglycerol kinase (ATP)